MCSLDEAVRCFIGADGFDHVEKGRVRLEAPVRDGNLGCLRVGPFGETSVLDVIDASRAREAAYRDQPATRAEGRAGTDSLGVDGFFFEARDEAVGDTRGEEVGDEESVVEDTLKEKKRSDQQRDLAKQRRQDEPLRKENEGTEEPAWIAELHEGEEVH